MRYLLLGAPILLMIVYSESVMDPVLMPRMLALGIIAILGLVAMVKAKDNPVATLSLPKLLSIAFVSYLIYIAATIPMAVNLSEAIFDFCRTSLVFISFIVLAYLLQRVDDGRKMLALGILIAGFIAQLYGLSQLFSWIADTASTSRDFGLISSILANKNLYASFILFSMPFAGWLLMKKSITPIVPSFYLAISLFSILALQTRAAWLALGISAGIVILLLLIRPGVKGILHIWKNMGPARIYTPLLLLLGGGMFIGMLSMRSELKEDAYQRTAFVLQNPSSDYVQMGSVGNRLQMWQYSLEMFGEDPIFGKGPASWQFLLPSYGTVGNKTSQGTVHYAHPHNDYLWVLSQNGIVGLILYLIILLTPLLLALRMWFSNKTKDRTAILLLIFGLIAYAVIAGFSFPRARIMHQFLLVSMIAWVVYEANAAGIGRFFRPQAKLIKTTGLVLLLLSGAVVVVTIARINGEKNTKEIISQKARGKYQSMANTAASTKGIFYSVDPSGKPIAAYEGDALFQLRKYKRSEDAYKEALATHPFHLQVISNLGSCAEVLDRHDEAVLFYQRALELSPNFMDAVCNLCASYYNNGEYELAYETITNVAPEAPVSDKCANHLGIILTKQLQIKRETADAATTLRINELLIDKKKMIQAFDKAQSSGVDFIDSL